MQKAARDVKVNSWVCVRAELLWQYEHDCMATQCTYDSQMEAYLFHDDHFELQDHMRNPIVFNAEMMGDIMVYHQAIKQPDVWKFTRVVVKEVEAGLKDWYWMLDKHSDIPPDTDQLTDIWAMQHIYSLTT